MHKGKYCLMKSCVPILLLKYQHESSALPLSTATRDILDFLDILRQLQVIIVFIFNFYQIKIIYIFIIEKYGYNNAHFILFLFVYFGPYTPGFPTSSALRDHFWQGLGVWSIMGCWGSNRVSCIQAKCLTCLLYYDSLTPIVFSFMLMTHRLLTLHHCSSVISALLVPLLFIPILLLCSVSFWGPIQQHSELNS